MMSNGIHWPDWLLKLMSDRERKIGGAEDARVTNYDEDYPTDRLPGGQVHIISSEGRFTVDAKRRQIIS